MKILKYKYIKKIKNNFEKIKTFVLSLHISGWTIEEDLEVLGG